MFEGKFILTGANLREYYVGGGCAALIRRRRRIISMNNNMDLPTNVFNSQEDIITLLKFEGCEILLHPFWLDPCILVVHFQVRHLKIHFYFRSLVEEFKDNRYKSKLHYGMI